jgi:ATP/maltotriose-dependent transcriptional regulator MalT/DNA-binding SARP family transcriptional activator
MPERSASIAKITRPRIRGVFPRERLYGLLDEMRQYPVTWISAPAGSGKTTLVAGYLEDKKIPCLWYQVDEGDADLATFFSYLGMAAQKAAPRKRKPLPFLTPEYLQGIPTFTRRYFENLFGRFKPPSILVLDNYQTVPDESNLHEVINNGLSIIPDGINVFVISRHDPPSILAKLRANEQMKILGWQDLRLTPVETLGIVPLKTREIPSKEVIGQLHQTADGWVAGLVLILESMKRGVELQALQKMAPQEIIDYFGNEFFNKTVQTVRDFLLKTAFLPKITVKSAEKLTGLSNADSILSALSRDNYFTERHFSTEPVYQYHPLYRDFLMTKAREIFSPQEIASIKAQAARLLEEEGQFEAAISLYKDLGNWESMAQLIQEQATSMFLEGRIRPLEEWVGSLPQALLEKKPWLLFWMGSCRFLTDPGQYYFKKALDVFNKQNDSAGIYQSLASIVISITNRSEDYKALGHWIPVLKESIGRLEGFPSKGAELRYKTALFFAMFSRGENNPEMEERAEEIFSLAEISPNSPGKIEAFSHLLFYRSFKGDFGKAALVLKNLQDLTKSMDISPLHKIFKKNMEIVYLVSIGRYEECLTAVSEGLELSRTTGIQGRDANFLNVGIQASLGSNDLPQAEKLLEKMASAVSDKKGLVVCNYYLRKSEVALHKGNLEEASFLVDLAQKLAVERGFVNLEGLIFLRKAQILRSKGKLPEAAEQLALALTLCRAEGANHLEFSTFLFEVILALDQGKERSGLVSLRKALALGREKGYFNVYLSHTDMIRLCIKALESGMEVEYVQELILHLKNNIEKPPLFLETWPWPLKIYTLGRFELLKKGQPVPFNRKAQRKPLSLLKALIALGSQEVKEEELADFLWPEAEGDAAHHSFEVTLHRLRSLIGIPEALRFKDGRLSLNPSCCWVDIHAFEQVLAQARDCIKEGSTDRAGLLTQKAIEMYQGPFLAGETELPRVISISERLRNKFLRSVSWLGQYWEEMEKLKNALACYYRGLEVDDLAEELYRCLMRCHLRLGQKAEGLSVYNHCRKTLSENLGIEPSPETRAIYKSLHSNLSSE